MKIDDSHRPGNTPARKLEGAGSSREKALAPPQDAKAPDTERVHLSPRAREYHQARRALAVLPDEAPDKVRAIRDRIENGRYRVEADEIAAKMIREALANDE